MKTDSFASRHIGISEEDIQVMLRKIGVATLDELIDKTIPANIRLKEPLALPPTGKQKQTVYIIHRNGMVQYHYPCRYSKKRV